MQHLKDTQGLGASKTLPKARLKVERKATPPVKPALDKTKLAKAELIAESANANSVPAKPLRDIEDYPEVLVSMGPPFRGLSIEDYDRLDRKSDRPPKRNPKLAALLADSRKHITHG